MAMYKYSSGKLCVPVLYPRPIGREIRSATFSADGHVLTIHGGNRAMITELWMIDRSFTVTH
ncbi:hypothetical protein [Endozoicomonas sp. 2B-B]